jgi:hypothetical protein
MKKYFSGYYQLSKNELDNLWKQCIFILDANVLLNLYRYSKETSDDLISILKKISERIWIPFQACLEYQENRLLVIAEQVKKYREVQDILETIQSQLHGQLDKLQLKKRHSTINPDKLITKTEKIFNDFLQELKALEQGQPDVFDHDKIRDEIDSILLNKVGPPPESQQELDSIYEEGKIRYGIKRPPGYMDIDKEKDNSEVYLYRDLVIKRMYGDLILWKQIINHVRKQKELKHIIFLTDDTKEDWWWICESQGKKTIGPRPELIEELKTKGEIEYFYMYNSERFMIFAKQYLGIEVKEESINQVRNVALINRRESHREIIDTAYKVEKAVLKWLKSSYPTDKIIENQRFPDLIRIDHENDFRIGYEIKYATNPSMFLHRFRDMSYRGYYEINEGNLNQIFLVLITDDEDKLENLNRIIKNRIPNLPKDIFILTGFIIITNEEEIEIKLHHQPIQRMLFFKG